MHKPHNTASTAATVAAPSPPFEETATYRQARSAAPEAVLLFEAADGSYEAFGSDASAIAMAQHVDSHAPRSIGPAYRTRYLRIESSDRDATIKLMIQVGRRVALAQRVGKHGKQSP